MASVLVFSLFLSPGSHALGEAVFCVALWRSPHNKELKLLANSNVSELGGRSFSSCLIFRDCSLVRDPGPCLNAANGNDKAKRSACRSDVFKKMRDDLIAEQDFIYLLPLLTEMNAKYLNTDRGSLRN